jgi:hypothetical protein
MNVYIWTSGSLKNAYIGEYKGRLPSEYQEVEWIWATWTQYINTWLFPWNNIQTETKIELLSTEMDTPVLWWYRNMSSSISTGNYYHLTPYNYKWYCWLNWSETNWWTYNNVVGTQYIIVYNDSNNKLNVNNSDVVSVSWTTWYTDSVLCMALRWHNNAHRYWKYKYYYFKAYNKTTSQYERDLVPCYRKSDNVIWMYDIVNNQFYTNSWSWTFTKWPDV